MGVQLDSVKTSRKYRMLTLFRALTALVGLIIAVPTTAAAQQTGSVADIFAMGRSGDWDGAFAAVPSGDDLTRDLLLWTRLRSADNGAGFEDYLTLVSRRPDWPGLDRLRALGEVVMPAGLPPSTVIGWFGGNRPETGQGAVRLAQAMAANGDSAGAQAMLRDVWINVPLDEEGQAALLADYRDLLLPQRAARASAMLWRGRASDAAQALSLLDGDDLLLARTRLAFVNNQSDAEALFATLPARLAADAGLAYSRFDRMASRGDYSDAVALLTSRTGDPALLEQPIRWSGWRRTLARWELRQGHPQSAYLLASRHYLSPADGESYSDLEWLSGFIALRFLNQPDLALRHFQTMSEAVDTPISEGRAGYWIGRVHEARGDAAEAAAAYAEAARHQTGFYGLLASEKLGLPLDPSLTGGEVFPSWQSAPFLGEETARAALILLSAGERSGAVSYFAVLGRTLDRTELGQMGQILERMQEPFFEVLLGKAAVQRGILIPDIYFPLHPMAKLNLPVSTELALSIARRESEFRTDAGSAAGALGLMQLMPGTAQDVARDLGLTYSRGRLITDWEYNLTLGAEYLARLQDEFGPSPVFIAAGYNAGPRRPREWIADRGDPRLGEIDVIDWIEMIPFRETRNYVQRVAESIPIYRARLTGQTATVRFTPVLIGEKPVIRPLARPNPNAPQPQTETRVVEGTLPPAPVSALAPTDSLRPVRRP